MKVKRAKRKYTIQNQLIAMFLMVIMPLFAASIFLLVNMRSTVKDATLGEALSTADSIKYRITDIIGSAEITIRDISSRTDIISFLSQNHTDKQEYIDFYNTFSPASFTTSAPQIKSIYIFVPSDDFVFNATFLRADEEIKAERWYKSAVGMTTEIFWDVVKNPSDGEYYLGCVKALSYNSRVVGVACAVISNEWLSRFISDEPMSTVLSVDKGTVYFSNYEGIAPGQVIEPCSEFLTSTLRKTYDEGFFGYKGYTALENFYMSNSFQIIILLPGTYVNYEVNRLSVVYGGYCGLLIILSLLIIILFSSMFSRRIQLLSEKMHAVAGGCFAVEFNDKGNDEITDLYSDLERMISDMQRLINDSYSARLEAEAFRFNQIEAEFKALASQINPHFLYNTLETIRMKAYCNNDKETADLVKKLGKFMRRCLELKDDEVTLRSELEFTNSYLELQSARFGDRISYSIYSEVAKEYMTLPLLIQPIVENAFVHGIESSKSNGRVDIKVYYHGDSVYADVKDNGQGMTPERLQELKTKLEISDTSSGKSIGLTNVHKRIKMYYGDKYGMTIKSTQGKGTTVTLRLPREPVNKMAAKKQLMELTEK